MPGSKNVRNAASKHEDGHQVEQPLDDDGGEDGRGVEALAPREEPRAQEPRRRAPAGRTTRQTRSRWRETRRRSASRPSGASMHLPADGAQRVGREETDHADARPARDAPSASRARPSPGSRCGGRRRPERASARRGRNCEATVAWNLEPSRPRRPPARSGASILHDGRAPGLAPVTVNGYHARSSLASPPCPCTHHCSPPRCPACRPSARARSATSTTSAITC